MFHHNHAWCRNVSLFTVTFFACLGASAQDATTKMLNGIQSPLPVTVLPGAAYKTDVSYKRDSTKLVNISASGIVPARTVLTAGSDGVCRVTLEQVQEAAAGAGNPLVRLGELQVEAARQHRKGVESLYFPNIGSQFENLHFNKQTGDVITIQGPLGMLHEVQSKIIGKDQTAVNVGATQPITPLFAIRQLVKIARADENIAKAKAGMPVTEAENKLQEDYFNLLVAQRELAGAEADAKKVQAKWLSASTGRPTISAEQEAEMISAEKAVLVPASKVNELTASLDEVLGLPDGTKLELTPPEPFVENLSLTEVTDKAMTANAEVVEAEQTAIKAHAAATISKMAYGPTVAVTGGYMNQNALEVVLPRAASYIGVVATYTVFDFGKREHDVSEAKANAEAADLGVQLTKAKVAGAVKSTYFGLESSANSLNWRAGWCPRISWLMRATNPATRKSNRHRRKWKQRCLGLSSNIARRTPR